MPRASQGHDFRLYWLFEDGAGHSFKTETPDDNSPKAFGSNATGENFEGSNQAVQVFGPNSRIPKDVIAQVFEGSWSVSFQYTNPWWLSHIYAKPEVVEDTETGTFTHTWEGEDTTSTQIVIGRTENGSERVLRGCVCTSASVSVNVGGPVQVSLQGAYAEEGTRKELDEQPEIGERTMTFAQAGLEQEGETLGYVQQGSVQLQNNMELINEWGSRIAIDYAPRQLVPNFNFSKINEAGETEQLEEMYGGTTIQERIGDVPDMAVSLDNGETGSDMNRVAFNLLGPFPDSYGESGIGDPQADVTEEVNRAVEEVTAEAELGTEIPT